jgi:hypothetical protein
MKTFLTRFNIKEKLHKLELDRKLHKLELDREMHQRRYISSKIILKEEMAGTEGRSNCPRALACHRWQTPRTTDVSHC